MNLRCLAVPFAALLFLGTATYSEEGVAPVPKVVAQKDIGVMACGPCSLLNALKFGGGAERDAAGKIEGDDDTQRVRTLIEKYGRVPSDAYPKRARYRDKGGMADLEMLGMVNDYLREAKLGEAEGFSLDRTKVEAPGQHLRQIHTKLRRSLDAGLPPLIIFRSFVVKSVEKPKKGSDGFVWWGQSGHWVSVIDVPKELEPGALGFAMRVADSWTGIPQTCFIHEEQFRNFTAAKGDDLKWVWPTIPQPYLVATVPALGLGVGGNEMRWYLRSNVVLSYGIFRN